MFLEINNIKYPVEIIKKNNKNTYIRMDENLVIKVTTGYLTPKIYIKKLLEDNKKNIEKMLIRQSKRVEKNSRFFYLGQSYDIIEITNIDDIKIDGDKIYIPNNIKFNKWYKNQIKEIFNERYQLIYNMFEEVNICPLLKIRTMKTRWGVYNKVKHTVTLNSKLIEHSYDEIDYVIIHELSHVIHFNHSSSFWNLVEKYCPNYKMIRKKLKE